MLRGYFEQIRMLLSDPTSNLTAAAMGISLVVVFIVLIALILLFFALTGQGPRRKKRGGRPARPKRPVRLTPDQIEHRLQRRRLARRVWWTTIAGGILISWIALFAGTSVNLYCGNTCHSMVGPSDTWRKSPHKQVSCVRCHEGRPATTFLAGSVSRVRSVYYQLSGAPADRIPLPSTRCLSCHEAILDKTLVTDRAIAVSHREPIESGAACADCHGAQGHAESPLTVGMSACLPCHDGVQAPAECSTCHPKGIEAGLKIATDEIGHAVRLPEKPTCGGCHSQESCDACHGLRMPHPEDFKTPQRHARPAAFEAKTELCYRCHGPAFCLACHRDFGAHGPDWKAGHTRYDRSHGDGYCRWCHRTPNFCAVCH